MRSLVGSQGGIPVHGEITIELKRKHGRMEKKVYNMLTQFGKSYVLANGLARQYGVNTAHYRNKIYIQGKDAGTAGQTAQTGPYLNDYRDSYIKTDGSRICNMLLNNPPLNVNKGLYLPTSSELAAFAYADSSVSGALNEGSVAILADQGRKDNAIVRRFQYGTDLACEFDTIAMSTKVPGNTGSTYGRIVPQFRSVLPIVYSSSIEIERIGVHKLSEGKLVIEAGLYGNTYTLDLNSGIIVPGGTANVYVNHYDGTRANSTITAFSYGNYTYVIYVNNDGFSSGLRYAVYDSTGTLVAANKELNSGYGLVYYNNKFYAVTSGTWYEMVEGTNSYLEVDTSASITAPYSLSSSNLYAVMGTPTGGYTNISCYYRYYSNTGGTTYKSFLDSEFNITTAELNENAMMFSYNGAIYSVGAGEAQEYDWANKVDGLIEFGNLLSFHTLSETITKNVGDLMYVTYAYTMN